MVYRKHAYESHEEKNYSKSNSNEWVMDAQSLAIQEESRKRTLIFILFETIWECD
jgi:hypothetical protein